jgi:hypothetical protein
MIWLLLALAVSAGSITMARSAMLVRYRRGMKSIHPTLGALSGCHYCTSHWLAALAVGWYRPSVGAGLVADLLVGWLAVVGGAALISGIIMFFTPFNSEE